MRIDLKYQEFCTQVRYIWIHFVNSAGNLEYINESWEKEYTMGDVRDVINWEAFARVKYPKEESHW